MLVFYSWWEQLYHEWEFGQKCNGIKNVNMECGILWNHSLSPLIHCCLTSCLISQLIQILSFPVQLALSVSHCFQSPDSSDPSAHFPHVFRSSTELSKSITFCLFSSSCCWPLHASFCPFGLGCLFWLLACYRCLLWQFKPKSMAFDGAGRNGR